MKKDKIWSQITYKNMMWMITYTLLFVLALMKLDVLGKAVTTLFSLIKPFILGFAIAYVFSIPMRFFQRKLPEKIKKGRTAIAGVCALICVIAVLVFVVSVVFPQVVDSIALLIEEFPTYAKATENTLLKYMRMYNLDQAFIEQWNVYSKQIEEAILQVAASIVPMLMNLAGGLVSTLADAILAIVSAIYFTLTKDTLIKNVKKVAYAFMNEKMYAYSGRVAILSDKTFSNFISGQLVEAFIIGILCYIGAIVLKLEYAVILAVIVGCTNVVPIFGPIIGTIVCAVLLLFVNPMQALVFVIFGLVLQQVESNLIYPKVVGSSVGLSGVWVLLAVSVGGGLFGAIGMILGLPVFAIMYRLFADEVHRRIKVKKKEAVKEDEQ